MSAAEEINNDILTVPEASKYLKMSERTIRTLIAEEEIPFTRIGRSIRFSREELQKWFKRKTVKVD